MKRIAFSCVAFLISIAATGGAMAQQLPAAAGDDSFRAFLPSFEEGMRRFLNGDPTLWKQNASRAEDATIMGAWGAYEKGWNEVGPRYDWAVSRFKKGGDSKLKVEYLSSGVSGDLAYTVAIERSEVHLVDQEKPAAMALRATHLFRKEGGKWKLLHRHADPIASKTAPVTVLQK
jgi:ketosteroid isomerase-like protein